MGWDLRGLHLQEHYSGGPPGFLTGLSGRGAAREEEGVKLNKLSAVKHQKVGSGTGLHSSKKLLL